MGIYLEGDNGYISSDTIPESGYALNSEESYCKKGDNNIDVTISYDFTNKAFSITAVTSKGLKCYLYFDVKVLAKDAILANINTITTRSSFSSTYTSATTKTVFTTKDDDGTSYYYAGAPTDDWVKFAGYYWRIIRINGDGSIILIYNGTTTSTTGTGTQLSSTSAFNSSYDNNMYVGFMYTSGQVHGLETKSTILGQLETFYSSKLASHASYLDPNAGFCGDRTPYTDATGTTIGGETGTTTTYYGAYIRLQTNKMPNLKCTNSDDLYTMSSLTKGNKALTNPIGLITADEAAYAGGVNEINNRSYYLYTYETYWTISPYSFDYSAYNFVVATAGGVSGFPLSSVITVGIRPVINLRVDTEFKTGSLGTASSPYEVV